MTITQAISHWLSNLSVSLSILDSYSLRQSVCSSGPSCSKGGNAIRFHLLKLYPVEIAAGWLSNVWKTRADIHCHSLSVTQSVYPSFLNQSASQSLCQPDSHQLWSRSLFTQGIWRIWSTSDLKVRLAIALCTLRSERSATRTWKSPSTWNFICVYYPSRLFASHF